VTRSATLTIAFPTYNRFEAVSARLAELSAMTLEDGIRVLVTDNASPDDTYRRLRDTVDDPRVTILRNDANLGYAGNILRIAETAETDFVTYVSDEDAVDPEGLAKLVRFCREVGPAFVIPRAQTGQNDCYRGRRETREIAPEEFQTAAFYVSGLTFAKDVLRSAAPRVRALIPTNSAATVYPQVLLSALAVAGGRSWFLDALVTKQAIVLPTDIEDPVSRVYNQVPARWAQFLGYEEFFTAEASSSTPEIAERYARMRDAWRTRQYALLLDAAERQVPGMSAVLQESAAAAIPARPGLRARVRGLLPR